MFSPTILIHQIITSIINKNLEQQASCLLEHYSNNGKNIALNEVINFVGGFAFKSETYLSEGLYKIITIKNVQDGNIDSNGASCINDVPPKMKESCFLQPGDILLSLTGYVGRTGIVTEENLLLNQRVAKLVAHKRKHAPFLYFMFRQDKMKHSLERISKGTAQQNLSPVEALSLSVPFSMNDIDSLSVVLKPMFDVILHNQKENRLLSSIREALLPKLMSGELDVSAIQL